MQGVFAFYWFKELGRGGGAECLFVLREVANAVCLMLIVNRTSRGTSRFSIDRAYPFLGPRYVHHRRLE
jgi:hypothetical protein